MTPESRRFELSWDTYVAYSVRNECYTGTDDYEVYEGRLLVVFRKSRYLDFIGQATFANDLHPAVLQHWGVFCLNHTIDVVSVGAPQILPLSEIDFASP